jgi:aminopeptidase N
MHIPIRFGLVGQNGEDLAYEDAEGAPIADDVIKLTEGEHTIVFRGVSTRPVVSLLRGFSAPVRLNVDLSAADLLFLTRTDADQFNRWQAAQTLAMRALIAGTEAVRGGGSVVVDDALVDALADVAEDDRLEAAFRAQVLHQPSEADVARDIGRDVDPDAIHAARNAMRAAVAARAGARLAALVDRLDDGRPFVPDAESAGRRALASAALDLMVANGDRGAIDRVVARFAAADNMTDRSAALAILAAAALPERQQALAAFYDRYRDDHLVLDKWLTFEATVPHPATLERVRALLDHPAFSLANPNRIRALVGAFAGGNQTQFNRPDGAGYEFLADFVIGLDRRNPQTAARLLVSFRSWRALEPRRRALAEAALRRVAAMEESSPDTRDIVTRTLA